MVAPGEAPPFWWQKGDWRAVALWPFSALYGAVAALRMRRAPRLQVEVPVLCVGNLTVGGEGKTPVAIALARAAIELGHRPGFLSRGHGGSHSASHLVNAIEDSARLVGDEPLLLARHAPAVVSSKRADGARRLIAEGCDLIIMDDGFQSAHLHMDFALIVVDAKRGLGNGHVIPGGPLRAPLLEQIRHLDGVVTMGKGAGADLVVRRTARAGRPVFTAAIHAINGADFAGQRVMAFAGIGNPEKFYATLRLVGAEVVATRSFADHHPFSKEELDELLVEAQAQGLKLVTTEKDLVRITNGMVGAVAATPMIRALAVEAVFDDLHVPRRIIQETIAAGRKRLIRNKG